LLLPFLSRFLARYSPNLARISCCFASDRLYGGSLLESSLGCLAGCTPRLTYLTLLNVDVTDVVLQHFARHCPALQHVAIGRTENNAFGNFVSDEGLAALASSCRQLSSLSLFRCYSCSDAGLRELAAQGRQLTSLVLHSCPQVGLS
jgi:EIN3-binding F-box protein